MLADPGVSWSRTTPASSGARFAAAPAGVALSTLPDLPSSSPQPSVSRTTSSSTDARPSLPTAAAVSVRCAWKTCSRAASSCLATARDTALVMARKGVARGTCSNGSPARPDASTSARGTAAWLNPIPKPSAATPAVARRST